MQIRFLLRLLHSFSFLRFVNFFGESIVKSKRIFVTIGLFVLHVVIYDLLPLHNAHAGNTNKLSLCKLQVTTLLYAFTASHTHTKKKKSERSVELYVYSFVSGRDPTKVLDTECERQIEIGFSQNTIIVCSSSMHIQLSVPCYTFTCLHSFFSEELLPS